MTDTWPRIGMPVQLDPNEEKQYLSRCYSDAVASAEGIPILLPLIAAPEAVRPLVETLDGILLTGSDSDVDPSLYGAVRLDACGPAQPLRDRMDSFLLDAAVKHRIPVLAICYGIQSLNVCLGGSLIQDIASAVGTSIRHSGAGLGDTPRHPVRIEPGSLLESAAGRREAWVNSTHHQAIDRLGRGLEVIARGGRRGRGRCRHRSRALDSRRPVASRKELRRRRFLAKHICGIPGGMPGITGV